MNVAMCEGAADPDVVKAAILNRVADLCTADVVAQFMASIDNARMDGIHTGREDKTLEIREVLGIS